MLWERHPDLWRLRCKVPKRADAATLQAKNVPSIERIVMSRQLVRRFVDAIGSFWDETEYILSWKH